VKADAESTAGRVAVIEHLAPRGAGSPLHVHRNEDEWFSVTEGEVTFWVGGQTFVAGLGAFVYGPRGVPRTSEGTSEQARFLLVAEPAGFERFVREVGEPAATRTIPPPPDAPPDLGQLVALASRYGIEIIGPPGIPS